jgi:hypothetical protein
MDGSAQDLAAQTATSGVQAPSPDAAELRNGCRQILAKTDASRLDHAALVCLAEFAVDRGSLTSKPKLPNKSTPAFNSKLNDHVQHQMQQL